MLHVLHVHALKIFELFCILAAFTSSKDTILYIRNYLEQNIYPVWMACYEIDAGLMPLVLVPSDVRRRRLYLPSHLP